jgi:hypothetical protein
MLRIPVPDILTEVSRGFLQDVTKNSKIIHHYKEITTVSYFTQFWPIFARMHLLASMFLPVLSVHI